MVKSIIYESNTNHTKQYAEMLGDILKIPVYNVKDVKKKIKKNEEIIFLGWVCASKIQGLNKVKKYNIKCIGAVGAYPTEQEYINSLKLTNKIGTELFYLRGGIDYNKLKGFKKKLLQFVGKMMTMDDKIENKEMVELFKNGANFVSKENVVPMVKYIENK